MSPNDDDDIFWNALSQHAMRRWSEEEDEIEKVQKCPKIELPLLIGSLKHQSSIDELERRFKE